MSRPRFLADQDFNERILRGVLRQEPAIEFLRAREAGVQERSDSEVLAYAATAGWIVLSHDVNTMSAAATARIKAGQAMSGLALVHQLAPFAPVIESIVLIWATTEAEEWRNQIQFLPL